MAMTHKDALEKYGSRYRLRKALLDLLNPIKQFSQGQSCLPELHRAHAAQR